MLVKGKRLMSVPISATMTCALSLLPRGFSRVLYSDGDNARNQHPSKPGRSEQHASEPRAFLGSCVGLSMLVLSLGVGSPPLASAYMVARRSHEGLFAELSISFRRTELRDGDTNERRSIQYRDS